jgi:hypothetical protein
MKYKTWKFRAILENVDIKRICREAAGEGLDLIQVSWTHTVKPLGFVLISKRLHSLLKEHEVECRVADVPTCVSEVNGRIVLGKRAYLPGWYLTREDPVSIRMHLNRIHPVCYVTSLL